MLDKAVINQIFLKLTQFSQNDILQDFYLQYLSVLNKILILSLERGDFQNIWDHYLLQLDIKNFEVTDIVQTQIQFLKDKNIIFQDQNDLKWHHSRDPVN